MKIKYKAIGICGLSCRLCPSFNTDAKSRCYGCKSSDRMAVGCPFITCAIKKKGVEFCWECADKKTCKLWKNHRAAGKKGDSFKCYQKLEDDISYIEKHGVIKFEKTQKAREKLLKKMLEGYNESRSKSYYCIAATVVEIKELEAILGEADKKSKAMGLKQRSMTLHGMLNDIAAKKKYILKLRKQDSKSIKRG